MLIPRKAAQSAKLAELRAKMDRYAERKAQGLQLRKDMRPELDYRSEGDPKQIVKRNKRET